MHLLLEPLLRLFAALVSHGGLPRPDRNQFGPVLLYPLRPGVLLFFLGCLLFSVYSLVSNLPHLLRNHLHPPHPLALGLGLFLAPVSLLLLARTLSVDEIGLHHRGLLRSTTIPWSDLHHVERYQSSSARKSTFYIRSADNRTTITLPEMTYNTAHLLSTLRDRVPLPELPRRRRHWWGG